ncbi:hypothetical protein Bca4012_077596 [Brassica carinata]
MLPSEEVFAAACSALGIENKDGVVVYDGKGIFSAARVWWMFRVFGHESVWVLDGGLPKWRASGYEVESSAYAILKSNVASEAAEKVYQGQPVSLFIHTFMFCFSGLGLCCCCFLSCFSCLRRMFCNGINGVNVVLVMFKMFCVSPLPVFI